MMSMAAIRDESERAARRAAREHLQPYVVFDAAEVARLSSFPFPFLGDYVPKGWKRVDELFCDSSGMGSADEPALTRSQLKAKLLELVEAEGTYGFAITEAGQFQAYVGVYKKVAVKARKAPKAPRRDSKDVWPKGEEGAAS